MSLWILRRNELGDYDTFDAFVVRAGTAEEAVAVARREEPRRRYHDAWTDDVTATEIAPEGSAEVILGSFNAGVNG